MNFFFLKNSFYDVLCVCVCKNIYMCVMHVHVYGYRGEDLKLPSVFFSVNLCCVEAESLTEPRILSFQLV